VTVTTPEYRHSPRTPRECRVICHGRSPDLRVVACVGPSRFPSGMCRTRSPLTVAGAVVGFHHVPFSPGFGPDHDVLGVQPGWAHCKLCRSVGDHGPRVGLVWGRNGNRWDCAWEKMGRTAQFPYDISNQSVDSGGNLGKTACFMASRHCGISMFLVCLFRLWEIMGNFPSGR
jgi:hypothetical protein